MKELFNGKYTLEKDNNLEQQLFKKLTGNLMILSKEYDLDTHISMFLIQGIWDIKINGIKFSGTDLEEVLKKAIEYFDLSNFRNKKERVIMENLEILVKREAYSSYKNKLEKSLEVKDITIKGIFKKMKIFKSTGNKEDFSRFEKNYKKEKESLEILKRKITIVTKLQEGI